MSGMAPSTPEDPFHWDTARVCKELCFEGAQWTSDPLELEALLRENEMDGEVLLTYELLFSRTRLMECLGITAARHQIKIIRKLMQLQKQSAAFQQEKKKIDNDLAFATVHEVQTATQPITASPPPSLRSSPTTAPRLVQPDSEVPEESATSDQPAPKRRRLAPTFVKDIEPDTAAPRMPGFEEPITSSSQNKPRAASVSSSVEDLPTAYLGKASIAESITPLGLNYESGSDSDSDSDAFQFVARSFRPRGKTRAINSMLKQYLRKNNRKLYNTSAGNKGSVPSDEGQDIVDFDDLPSLDEDTLREIEDEEEENKQANSTLLGPETAEEIINEEISKFKTEWEEKRLPKYERKAYRLWTHARKNGLLRQRAFEAHKQTVHLRNRLGSLTRDLRVVPWKAHEELRFQALTVEQTVCDKLHQEWLTNLFSLRSAPSKPAPLPTQRSASARKKFVHIDELVSSSEDEALEEFIVPDEEPAFARADSERPPRAISSPAAIYPHQTPPESPASSAHIFSAARPNSFIDLTVASDIEMDGTEDKMVPSTFDPFTQDLLAEIGNIHPKVWAKQKDRFRLAISILWKLDFERRAAIFELLAEQNVSDVWLDLVDKAHDRLHESDKISAPDAAFDLTLVFLSFLRCRLYKEARILKMSEKDVENFEDSDKSFPPFCGFLASIKDDFPQRNQIALVGDDDDELMELDGPPDDAAKKPDSAKKTKKKQIILDKGGVALRENESKLMKEQERRRDELRAAMRAVDPKDIAFAQSPRFIINESKTDDQGFIYVHPAISPRIKDHQIEGVRFLWNHIVRNPSERQGCLLAHTMGLGKTMQTITFLVALRESALSNDPTVRDQIPRDLRDWKVLVLCPSGLVENWKDEFAIWAPEAWRPYISSIEAAHTPFQRIDNAKTWAADGGVLIIGYNMFKSGYRKGDENTISIDKILVENATVVVADEAHSLKSPKAKVTQVASELKTSTRIALTGSPLANNVEEYYAMLNWVAPNFLGPLQEFREMYATPIQQGLYHDSSNYEKRKAIKLLQVLKQTAAPKVHRATIKSCLKDELPPKEEFVISVPPTSMQRRLYDLYMQATNSGCTKISQTSLFGVLNHLALICAHPAAYRRRVIDLKTKAGLGQDVAKFPMETIPRIMQITADPQLDRTELSYKVELLNKILDQSGRLGDKVLVFSQSIPTLDYLAKLFEKQQRRFSRLDGSTQISKRQDMVKRFNTGDAEVYLISTTAGGVGLNIYGANRVVIFDFKWNPVQDQQAIGRAYRIGQTKPVFVYRFVVGGSFEDDLQNKAVFKMQLASRVVDQKNVVSWSKRTASLMHLIKDVDATNARFDFKGKDAILDHILDHDNSRAILSIMSSDTFEEEDETATLTAAERQEAESMVQRHNLRMTDPEKYNQVMEAERITYNHRPVSLIASGKPNKDSFGGRPKHASEETTLSSHVEPTAGHLSRPMPIPGANTFFGPGNYIRGASTKSLVLPSNGATVFTLETCREARQTFEHKLATALAVVVAPNTGKFAFDAWSKARSIANDIQAERAMADKGLQSDILRWNMLTGKLGNKKLILSLASGQISAAFMAATPESDMTSRIQMMQNLSDWHLLNDIQNGGKVKDPESLSTIMRSPTQWIDNSVNKNRAMEDALVMRRASSLRNEERTDREPQLPSWASKVLGSTNGQGRLMESLLNKGFQ